MKIATGAIGDRVFLSFDEATARLADGPVIHTCRCPNRGVMLVAGWARDDVLKFLTDHRPELSGPNATSQGYGIAAQTAEGSWVFFETKTPE